MNRLIRRILRRLTRDGLLVEDPEQPWLDLEPTDTLDHLNAASIGSQPIPQDKWSINSRTRSGTAPHTSCSVPGTLSHGSPLVPRPRTNLIRYHGVFALSSPMRHAIVPTQASPRQRQKNKDPDTAPATRQNRPAEPPTDNIDTPIAPLTWAQRLKRVFEIDITLCPLCGGQLRIIADINDPELIGKILDHVQQRAPPRLPPRRT